MAESSIILIGLFLIQKYGTHRVGGLFGPVMIVWFIVIAGLGVMGIARQPAVLGVINPVHAMTVFRTNGFTGFAVLGAVFLVVTGGEALYADMGHFGVGLAWFVLVLPALILNYLGQGALLLVNTSAQHHRSSRSLKRAKVGESPAWHVDVVIEFADEDRAIRFERYLKSASGCAFAQRHLR